MVEGHENCPGCMVCLEDMQNSRREEDDQTINTHCTWCETPTHSNLKLCGPCWELHRAIEHRPSLAQRMLHAMNRSSNTSVEFNDVRAFHLKFELLCHDKPVHLTKRKLTERLEFMQEELNEFADSCGLSTEMFQDEDGERHLVVQDDQGDQDLAGQADALIDLVYVALGTAVMLGLPWIELWEDVQRANMAKVRGMTKRGHQVDVTKPPGWTPPITNVILQRAGYVLDEFTSPDKWHGRPVVDEEKCHDDV